MYKVRTQDLKSLKSQLEASNNLLAKIRVSKMGGKPVIVTDKTIQNQIVKNTKQINLLKNEYYID